RSHRSHPIGSKTNGRWRGGWARPRLRSFLAVLYVDVEAIRTQRLYATEVRRRGFVEIMAAAPRAHLARRVAEDFEDLRPGLLVTGVHHDQAVAFPPRLAQAGDDDHVGIGVARGPRFDRFAAGCLLPGIEALAHR